MYNNSFWWSESVLNLIADKKEYLEIHYLWYSMQSAK